MISIKTVIPTFKRSGVSTGTFLFYLSWICTLILLSGTAVSLHAQLNDDGQPHRISSDDNFIWFQRSIPNDASNQQELIFTLNGGDGGRRVVSGLCKTKGGQGATVKASFIIGNDAGKLQPGGTIRFIPGDKGDSFRTSDIAGAGGGGSFVNSAAIASEPSEAAAAHTTPQSTEQLLAHNSTN